MENNLCGVSKRHFRRLVKKELSTLQPIHENQNANETSNIISFLQPCDTRFEESKNERDIHFSTNKLNDPCDSPPTLCEKIAYWANRNNISHKALNEILKIMIESGLAVPKDSRTLLETPREVITPRKLLPGEYFHVGLSTALMKYADLLNVSEEILIDIGIDGLPLSKSSNSCLWPIMGSFVGHNVKPFIIGAFNGSNKPFSIDDYLHDFLNEYVKLCEEGIVLKNQRCFPKVRLFCRDAPARSFVSCVIGHQGSEGCQKCNQKGKKLNYRMVYSTIAGELRTDQSFIDRRDILHHSLKFRKQPTMLEKCNFKMVSQFPVEPMHLVDLGTTKKLLTLITKNNCTKLYLSITALSTLSSIISSYAGSIPSDFARKPRDLTELSRWKATEFRQFLLYTGIVALKFILNEEYYYHFLLLHCSIRLLSSKNCSENAECAQKMLQHFTTIFPSLYGEHNVSYNIHNLIHLAECVVQFGSMYSFSAYKFENEMQCILKLFRKNNKILQQLHNRTTEKSTFDDQINVVKKTGLHKYNKSTNSFKELYLEDFILKNSIPNNVCCVKTIEGNIPVVIKSFKLEGNCNVIQGYKFATLQPFFEKPLNSITYLGIYEAEHLIEKLEDFDSSQVVHKFVKINYKEHKSILIPIIHHIN